MVATFRTDDEHPKKVFVHHADGLGGVIGGMGGSSDIESVILRDRDTVSARPDEVEKTRDEHVYYVQTKL